VSTYSNISTVQQPAIKWKSKLCCWTKWKKNKLHPFIQIHLFKQNDKMHTNKYTNAKRTDNDSLWKAFD